VPQSSVISPTLFTICIDEISYVIENTGTTPNIYADDISFYNTANEAHNLEDKLQHTMSAVENWAENGVSKSQPKKTVGIIFGKREANPIRIKLRNQNIKF